MASKTGNNINIINKKAKFEYEFLDQYTVGIMLTGGEVKSLRQGKGSIKEAYCLLQRGELFIHKMYIADYKFASTFVQSETRTRKLLLKRKELKRIERFVHEKGNTIIPYRVYFNERGLVKLDIAVAKGKKVHDKRETIKKRDSSRDLQRVKKQFNRD